MDYLSAANAGTSFERAARKRAKEMQTTKNAECAIYPLDIAAIAALIEQLYRAAFENRSAPVSPDDENTFEDVWEKLASFGQLLADTPSSSPTEIKAKIAIWRLLTPDSGDENDKSVDETLANALIEDIDRYLTSVTAREK